MQKKTSYRKQDVFLVLIHRLWIIHWLSKLDNRNTLSWFIITPQTHITDQMTNCMQRRVKKTWVFFKKPNPVGFWVLLGFLDKQEKLGKIIQKLSNLKP